MAARPEAAGRRAPICGRATCRVPGRADDETAQSHVLEVIQRFIRAFRYETMPWREAQDAGLLWAPLRKPHENALDQHWLSRGTFTEVEHPELGRSFRYATSKWLSTATAWQVGRRAPLLGEDTTDGAGARRLPRRCGRARSSDRVEQARLSPHGKPFPLQGVRILDFSWFLASAGGTRFLAGARRREHQGRVEGKSRHPACRDGAGRRPRTRAARRRHRCRASPIPTWAASSTTRTPASAASRSTSAHPRGPRDRQAAGRDVRHRRRGLLARRARRLGLGYDVLREIKPDIIYVQQSGMGSARHLRALRTVGPIAAAFAGTSEMSGLPEPAMPAGWGYSYLDWMGAYSFALAILGALHHRDRTGAGPVDRRVAVRGRPLPRRASPSSTGRPTAASGRRHRQPLAVQAGRAARRLSAAPARTAGSRSPASRRRNGERSPVSAGQTGWSSGSALRDAGGAARQPGCARRGGHRLDADAGCT